MQTTKPPMTRPPLTDREMRLYAVLWRQVMRKDIYDKSFWCWECGGHAPTRAAVRHAPGCVFFDLPQGTLAALDADWTAT